MPCGLEPNPFILALSCGGEVVPEFERSERRQGVANGCSWSRPVTVDTLTLRQEVFHEAQIPGGLSECRAAMAYHLEPAGAVFEDLRDVLSHLAQCAAAGRAGESLPKLIPWR
jgi:hypothetical protein